MAAKGWSTKRTPVRRPAPTPVRRPAPKPAPVKPATPPPVAAPVQRQAAGFVPDSIYNNAVDFSNRGLIQQTGNLDEEERATKHEFGIDDPTNPFSRQAALKKIYLARGRGMGNSMASRGQLYSGAHQRGVAQVRHGEERDTAALRTEYEARLKDIGGRRLEAQRAAEEERLRAQEEWMARQQPADYDTAAPAPTAPGAKAPAAKKPAAPVTRKRNGQTEYKWPNGTWHSRPHRGN
jgi:hypothetical protein